MHVPDSSLCSLHPMADERLGLQVGDKHAGNGIRRASRYTRVPQPSLFDCRPDMSHERGPRITCQNSSTNKRQARRLLDVELQTSRPPIAIQSELVCTACGRCLRRRGSGRAGTQCLFPRLRPACPPSLGRVGAGAAPGGRPATFSIRSCLLKAPCLSNATALALETVSLNRPPVALLGGSFRQLIGVQEANAHVLT